MIKEKLIDQISELNRSASADFLSEFTEEELQQYLDNLEAVWSEFKTQFVTSTSDFQEEDEREPAQVAG